jgi:hypothetical protein
MMNSQQRAKTTRKLLDMANDPEVQRLIRELFCAPTDSAASPKTLPKEALAILIWLRTVGAAFGLLGFGALLMFDQFWLGTIFVYSCFVLLIVDVWCEQKLTLRWKLIASTILLLFAGVFGRAFFFVSCPLKVNGFETDAEYPEGTTLSGIKWRPEFTELRVRITNDSDFSYDEVAVLLRPSSAIAAIAQQSNVPNVSFEDNDRWDSRVTDLNANSGSKTAVPLVLLGTDAGYKVRCPHLAARTTIEVEIALADIKWNPKLPNPNLLAGEIAQDKDFVIRARNNNDFASYWQGHAGGDVYAPRPTSSEFMKVEGSYSAVHRIRKISQDISLGGSIHLRQ